MKVPPEMTFDAQRYLSRELDWLNVMLQREIIRLRATFQLSLDEFRGLYISDEQVDAYLSGLGAKVQAVRPPSDLLGEARKRRREVRSNRSHDNPWRRLAEAFGLDDREQDVLLLAATIEHDLKYASILAYLNNDVSQRHPTVDLARRLFGDDGWEAAQGGPLLGPDSTLFRQGLLVTVESTRSRPCWRARGFQLAPMVWPFLVGETLPAEPAPGVSIRPAAGCRWDDVFVAETTKLTLKRTYRAAARVQCDCPVIMMTGRLGSGRVAAAEALFAESQRPIVHLDLKRIAQSERPVEVIATSAALAGALLDAVMIMRVSDPDAKLLGRLIDLVRGSAHAILIVAPADAGPAMTALADVTIPFDMPCTALRQDAWRCHLRRWRIDAGVEAVETLAERFKLNEGEITRAVRHTLWRREANRVELSDLFEAARQVSRCDMGSLATRVTDRAGWRNLVLPDVTLRLLHTIASAIKHRNLVFERWGLARHRPTAGGLTIMLTGSSGTGKTISAAAIAESVGLDLYKIDLSGIVSKYIGETEKNLNRIFSAANASNAILFFDEADALFGKRSEIKDAHDRFANIEIAYLLQKLEEHDGVVFLASNLSDNVDDAFARRLDFTVEFPIPDAPLRERLWRGMFPPEAPLGDDVQFDFLAERFELAGGDIRNVATLAAFLAAEDGSIIRMKQITQALNQQLIKQGKVRNAAQFGPYFHHVRTDRRQRPTVLAPREALSP